MIGLVVVSHSRALAQAAVELALQMVPSTKPLIAIAAGAGKGLIGTDATAVSAAIDEVASPDGVLVIMDLGSAVMSAEMALEFRSGEGEVRLSSAPFVEGLLAAVVTAASGASLDAVDREARAALGPKLEMLGDPEPPVARPPQAVAEFAVELTLVNPDGLHARPAAMMVSALAAFDAKVTVANQRTRGAPVSANSLIGLLSLGAKCGDVLRVAGSGVQATEALARATDMVNGGFGEA